VLQRMLYYYSSIYNKHIIRLCAGAGRLLHHLVHVVHQQAEDQGVDQHTHLGWAALSVGDVIADQREHARQVIGHGVGNKKEEDEASNLGHLVL